MERWLSVAQTLKIGEAKRVSCCGKSTSMIVSASVRGWSGYCFRCQASPFKPRGEMNLKEQARVQHELLLLKNAKISARVSLPDDYTTAIPEAGLVWLLKSGVSSRLRDKYRIGYSPRVDRVVMPVFNSGELVAVQLRAVQSGVKPKYMNLSGLPIKTILFNSVVNVRTDALVVVEDILSCIRVGEVANTSSILGTVLTSERAAKIAGMYNRAALWLDGDAAGEKGTRDAKRQLEFQGVDVQVIRTDKDPKCYSNREIHRILADSGLSVCFSGEGKC